MGPRSPVISIKRTLEVLVCVLTENDHPVVIVTPLPVAITRMTVLATHTRRTFVVRVRAVGLDQTITATTLLVQRVLRISVPATNTKLTSDVRAHVIMGLSRPTATVTQLPVAVSHTMVIATNTRRMLVFSVLAVGLNYKITATMLFVQLVARTLEPAMNTKLTSEVRAHVMGLSCPMATVILTTCPNFTKFSPHVTCGRGLVIFRR